MGRKRQFAAAWLVDREVEPSNGFECQALSLGSDSWHIKAPLTLRTVQQLEDRTKSLSVDSLFYRSPPWKNQPHVTVQAVAGKSNDILTSDDLNGFDGLPINTEHQFHVFGRMADKRVAKILSDREFRLGHGCEWDDVVPDLNGQILPRYQCVGYRSRDPFAVRAS